MPSGSRNHRALQLILITAVIGLLSGCASSTQSVELGAEVAASGQRVADGALSAYKTLAKQQDVDAAFVDRDFIVNRPNPGSPILLSTGRSPARSIKSRQALFSDFRRTYEAYQELTDTAFADQSKSAAASLLNSVNGLRGVSNIPEDTKGIISRALGRIVAEVQAGKIREHNQNLKALSEAYRELWRDDSKVWKEEFINPIYDGHARRLLGYPQKRFSEAALSKVMPTPFAGALNQDLYKLDQVSEIKRQRDAVNAEIDAVSVAFDALVSAHTELAKLAPSIGTTTEAINNIRDILPEVR